MAGGNFCMPILASSRFLQVSPRPSPTTTTNAILVRLSVKQSKYFSTFYQNRYGQQWSDITCLRRHFLIFSTSSGSSFSANSTMVAIRLHWKKVPWTLCFNHRYFWTLVTVLRSGCHLSCCKEWQQYRKVKRSSIWIYTTKHAFLSDWIKI